MSNELQLDAMAGFSAPSGSARSVFEQWISGPPYERETERWPQDETKHAWPGQHKDIAVQLAWESWQQAQNAGTQQPGSSGAAIATEAAQPGSLK